MEPVTVLSVVLQLFCSPSPFFYPFMQLCALCLSSFLTLLPGSISVGAAHTPEKQTIFKK